MSPRRRTVEELCNAARSLGEAERGEFLSRACDGDEELRLEVERTLAGRDSAGAGDLSTRTLRMLPAQLNSYEIVSLLGSGGMGQVYRAHDRVLGRDVALKILPQEFMGDAERVERFRNEARILASLNHPNIGAIYGYEQANGIAFLVLELVEGETLGRQRGTGSGEPGERLRNLSDIAAALGAAHRKGIIHRDIKPSNIMITGEGRVKVLDFGLARAAVLDASLTEPGRIAGTPAYMSPEQIRGRTLDARSDIWSFGCVAFELFAGERPFRGESAADLMAAILERPPRWQALPASTPARVVDLIRRCLERDPALRPSCMEEVIALIEEIRAVPQLAIAPRRRRKIGYAGSAMLAALLLLVGGGAFVVRLRPAHGPRSVAVLPFSNSSGDAGLQYLPDGFTERIIDRLSEIPDLKVISRSAVYNLHGAASNPIEAGRKLGVDAIVTGSIRQFPDHVEAAVELADCRSGRQIWGEHYRESNHDLFSFERTAVDDIAGKLRAKLEPAGTPAIAHSDTENAGAYRLYLQGRYEWNKRSIESYRNAIAYYQKALDLDSSYALAWVGIAEAWAAMSGSIASDEVFPRARAAAEQALKLDPQLAEAHASLGEIRFQYDWDWNPAEQELRRALALDANNAHAHSLLGRLLCVLGRFREAEREIAKAEELDPLSPGISTNVGFEHYLAREYEKAAKQFQADLDVTPGSLTARSYLAYVRVAEGRADQAIPDYERMLAANPSDVDTITDLARAYAVAKRFPAAKQLYARLQSAKEHQFVLPTQLAEVEAASGRRNEALQHLEEAYAARTWYMIFLKVEPIWDPLRGEARFQNLLRRMNLA